jgi:hypothetical protein
MKYWSEFKEEERRKTYKIEHSAIHSRPHGRTSTSPLIRDEHLAKRTECQQQARNVTDMAVEKPECCM